jgi:hypothetical protein
MEFIASQFFEGLLALFAFDLFSVTNVSSVSFAAAEILMEIKFEFEK